MLFFFALSCLAAATFGSVVLYQHGEKKRLASGGRQRQLPAGDGAPRSTPEPTLETLQPGDIVIDGGEDWLVAGTVSYREEADRWALHVLEGGARRRFLEVRPRHGRLEVAFVDVAEGLPRGQLLQGLTFRGQSFVLEGRGDARTTARGDVDGASGGGTLEWARYGAAGGGLLLVEDEGAVRRAFIGVRVPPSSLSLMSGELNRTP